MKPHELKRMRDSGFLREPESNETVEEVIRWYFSTVEARDVDYMSGVIKKLTWEDVKSLVTYEPTWIGTRDLAKYAFIADVVYINDLQKQRDSS